MPIRKRLLRVLSLAFPFTRASDGFIFASERIDGPFACLTGTEGFDSVK